MVKKMSIRQAAKYLDINISTLHRYKRDRILPFYKIRGTVFFLRSEIDQALPRQWLALLDKFLSAFKGLGIGEMTKERFKQSIKDGGYQVAKDYWDSLNSEIDVKNPVLRQTALAGSEIPLQNFYKALEALKNFIPKRSSLNTTPALELGHISFENGEFVVNDQAKEAILEEHCRVYLESEEEKDLHTKLTALSNAYNDFHASVDELGYLHQVKPYISNFINLDHYFMKKPEDGQIEIDSSSIKATCGWKALQERRQQQADRRRQLLSTSK